MKRSGASRQISPLFRGRQNMKQLRLTANINEPRSRSVRAPAYNAGGQGTIYVASVMVPEHRIYVFLENCRCMSVVPWERGVGALSEIERTKKMGDRSANDGREAL